MTQVDMDEFLGCIEYDAITPDNVHHYIRKNRSNLSSVLDCTSLLLRRQKVHCLEYVEEVKRNGDFEFKEFTHCGEKLDGLYVDEMFRYLCQIPGRNVTKRLNRYSEIIINYLQGRTSLMNLLENRRTLLYIDEPPFPKKRKLDKCDKILNLLDKTMEVQTKLEEFEQRDFKLRSLQSENRLESTCNLNVVREKFYNDISSILDIGDDSSSSEVSSSEINLGRGDVISAALAREKNRRDKGRKELSWNNVIGELGFDPNNRLKRMECGRLAVQLKKDRNLEQHKGMRTWNGRNRESNIYYQTDKPFMEEIVKLVYNPTAV